MIKDGLSIVPKIMKGFVMGKVAVITDSNSGITQNQAGEYGIYVLPMPFYIDEKLYLRILP